MEAQVLPLPDGRRIAYRRAEGRAPGVVFLAGFRSDMTGTKAHFLEAWARARGQAYVRFDYTGHGQSSGDFLASGIGDWAHDAREVVQRVCADLGTDFEEVDITTSPELMDAYAEQIPVTLVDGRQHDFWRVDERRLRAALA